jgi:hypothetical protein
MTDLAGSTTAPLRLQAKSTADTTPPKLTLIAPRSQRLRAGKGVAVRASCDEACSLLATGRVTIPTRLVFELTPARASLAGGGGTRLMLRFRKATQRRFLRLLTGARRARAMHRVRAVDTAGNAVAARRVVAITRS